MNYKQKYIKYKNKYLELKSLQTGGFLYSSGQYIFFIPESKKDIIDNKNYVKDNIILNLNTFTTNLDNCTKFMKIGSTINGSYDEIYTNQSSYEDIKGKFNDIKKTTNNMYETSKSFVNENTEYIKETTNDIFNKSELYIREAIDIANKNIQKLKGCDNDSTKLEQSDNISNKDISSNNKNIGGNLECYASSIKLPDCLKGFKFDDQINESNLVDYIKLINLHQNSNKISKIIIIEKKINIFGTNEEVRLKYIFDVNYTNDKIIVSKK